MRSYFLLEIFSIILNSEVKMLFSSVAKPEQVEQRNFAGPGAGAELFGLAFALATGI
jgi:hypothetical protein